LALLWVSDRFSRGVVVVAEVFSAQAGAAATVAVGEDVAALVLFRGLAGVVQGVPPPVGQKVCKVFGRNALSPDLEMQPVKCEGPAW
jgi:hypothetical protein